MHFCAFFQRLHPEPTDEIGGCAYSRFNPSLGCVRLVFTVAARSGMGRNSHISHHSRCVHPLVSSRYCPLRIQVLRRDTQLLLPGSTLGPGLFTNQSCRKGSPLLKGSSLLKSSPLLPAVGFQHFSGRQPELGFFSFPSVHRATPSVSFLPPHQAEQRQCIDKFQGLALTFTSDTTRLCLPQPDPRSTKTLACGDFYGVRFLFGYCDQLRKSSYPGSHEDTFPNTDQETSLLSVGIPISKSLSTSAPSWRIIPRADLRCSSLVGVQDLLSNSLCFPFHHPGGDRTRTCRGFQAS